MNTFTYLPCSGRRANMQTRTWRARQILFSSSWAPENWQYLDSIYIKVYLKPRLYFLLDQPFSAMVPWNPRVSTEVARVSLRCGWMTFHLIPWDLETVLGVPLRLKGWERLNLFWISLYQPWFHGILGFLQRLLGFPWVVAELLTI